MFFYVLLPSLLSFPVLQKLGTHEKVESHWYMLSQNMDAKKFEVLDSLRDEDNEQKIEHATRLVDVIKDMYRINYSESKKQIQDYELVFIDVPK